MSQLLRLLDSKSDPRLASLNTLFPSNAVFDLDATIAASYPGSGQVWNNLVAAPADSAAKSAYNFNLGADSGATGSDPTFTGTPGNAGAYWLMDGSDYFSLAGTITAFLNNLHKRVSHTVIIAAEVALNTGADIGLFSTTDTTNAANIGMCYSGGFSFGYFRQRNLAVSNITSSTNLSSMGVASGNKLIVISFDAASNDVRVCVNSSTGITLASTWVDVTADVVGVKPTIGSFGNAAARKFPNGSKVYSCAMLNKSVDSSEIAGIISFYNKRHLRTYA